MPAPKTDDAIYEDALADVSPDDVKPRPKSKRELDMEQLEASHLRRLEEESGVKLTSEDPPKDDQLAAQLADEELDGAAAAVPEVIADVAGRRIRVKVDGVEQDVPLDEVLRSYQKGSAADRRLEEATRLLKEAQEQARQQIAPKLPQQETAVTPPQAGPDELETAVKAALSNLYQGDDGAAAKELASIIARSAQPATPVVPDLDVGTLANQLQQHLDVKSALQKIKDDYPDIPANRDLEMLTLLKVEAKETEGMARSAAILAAADEVYATLGKKPGRQPEPVASKREEKLARKAAMDQLPAANVSAATQDQTEDDSPSAVIAAMAAKRLGQSLPR